MDCRLSPILFFILSLLLLSFHRHSFHQSPLQTSEINSSTHLFTFIFCVNFPPLSISNHAFITALHPFISPAFYFTIVCPFLAPPSHHKHTHSLLQTQHFCSAALCRHWSVLIYTFTTYRTKPQSKTTAHPVSALSFKSDKNMHSVCIHHVLFAHT